MLESKGLKLQGQKAAGAPSIPPLLFYVWGSWPC